MKLSSICPNRLRDFNEGKDDTQNIEQYNYI